jgi:DNA-directed RNA polymerase specialized sigma24 family protein
MLEELSKKDKIWREVAFRFTNNKDSADELVQKMYLRLLDSSKDIAEIDDNYIKVTLYHLFKSSKKNIHKIISIDEYKEIVTKEEIFDYSDRDLQILNEISKLSNEEKKLLDLNFDLSVGKISKIEDECIMKTHRKLIKIRKKVLKKGFETEYKNSRLKNQR